MPAPPCQARLWADTVPEKMQPVTRNCTNVGEGLGYRAFSSLPPGFPSVGSSGLTAAQRSSVAPRSVLARATPQQSWNWLPAWVSLLGQPQLVLEPQRHPTGKGRRPTSSPIRCPLAVMTSDRKTGSLRLLVGGRAGIQNQCSGAPGELGLWRSGNYSLPTWPGTDR